MHVLPRSGGTPFEVAYALENYDIEPDDFDEAVVDRLVQEPTSTVDDYMDFAKYFNDNVESCHSQF
jgi:hypothetical protein